MQATAHARTQRCMVCQRVFTRADEEKKKETEPRALNMGSGCVRENEADACLLPGLPASSRWNSGLLDRAVNEQSTGGKDRVPAAPYNYPTAWQIGR